MRGNLVEMSNYRRDLIFRVLKDQQGLLPIMHYFTKWKRCDDMLLWCIRNQMTGNNLLAWVHGEFSNSLISLVKEIVKRLDRDSEQKPLFADRDLIARY